MADQVLIIDDDTRLSAMLSDYLSENGFHARAAATARAGLEEIGRNPPDAVILDIMLPDLDGFETCRRIRAVSSARDLRGIEPFHRSCRRHSRRAPRDAVQSRQ